MTSSFIHLHNHSEYSLNDSLLRIERAVQRAAALGMDAFALTDHDSLAGVPSYLKACREHSLKPIVGIEFYFVEKRDEYNPFLSEAPRQHLLLLAKNTEGLQSLIKLQNSGWTQRCHQGRLSLLDWNSLESLSTNNLICLTACFCGLVASRLLVEDQKGAEAALLRLKKIFGDHLYLELMDHGLAQEKKILPMMIELSQRHNVPLVATNDCHYIDPEEAKLHRFYYKLRRGRTIAKENETDAFYLKSSAEMAALGLPEESLRNTVTISESIEPYDLSSLFSLDSVPVGGLGLSRIERFRPSAALVQSARFFGVPSELLHLLSSPEAKSLSFDEALAQSPAVQSASERLPHLLSFARALADLPERVEVEDQVFLPSGRGRMGEEGLPLRRIGRGVFCQFEREGCEVLNLSPSLLSEAKEDSLSTIRAIEIESEYHRGVGWYIRRRLDRARSCFQNVLAKDAAHTDALYQLGLVHYGMSRKGEALKAFERVMVLDPNFERAPFLYSWMGWSLYEIHHLEEAATAFENSLRLHSNLEGSLYGLGLVSFELGRHEISRSALERFLSLSGPHPHVAESKRMLSCLEAMSPKTSPQK